jgi:hypothetical protein
MKTRYQNEAAWLADFNREMTAKAKHASHLTPIERKYITGAEPKTSRAKLHHSAPATIRRTR